MRSAGDIYAITATESDGVRCIGMQVLPNAHVPDSELTVYATKGDAIVRWTTAPVFLPTNNDNMVSGCEGEEIALYCEMPFSQRSFVRCPDT
jgi:hypothetical protein